MKESQYKYIIGELYVQVASQINTIKLFNIIILGQFNKAENWILSISNLKIILELSEYIPI